MRNPMSTPPTMPMIEPTPAPIRVFKDAFWMRISKRMMATAMTRATSAERTCVGSPKGAAAGCAAYFAPIGSSTNPAPIRIPMKTSRMRTVFVRMTRGYYHFITAGVNKSAGRRAWVWGRVRAEGAALTFRPECVRMLRDHDLFKHRRLQRREHALAVALPLHLPPPHRRREIGRAHV